MENIVKFLQIAYSDENLAALKAHCEDGKLSFFSCCCLVGIVTADHALRGECHADSQAHFRKANRLAIEVTGVSRYGRSMVEAEFQHLGPTDEERRAGLLPLIEAEIARREEDRLQETEMQLLARG